MAENEGAAIMEVMEPLDMNLSLLSETENLPDDVILISPITPPLASLPAMEKHQLWMDAECGISSNADASDEHFSAKSSDSIMNTDPLFGSEFIPLELMQRVKTKTHKCSKCNKVFRSTYNLNKHLLTHQPERSHVCNICQKGFKRLDHLSSHMLTHQKRKIYHCSHPGCMKMYCGYHSLKRHCATQHGIYLLSSKFCNVDTQTCPTQSELPKLSAMNEGGSTSVLFPPLKPQTVFQSKDYTGCGTSYSSYTLAASSLSHNPYDCKLSQVKHLDSTTELSASHSMVMSNQWTSTSSIGGSVEDPVEPEAAYTLESNLDFLVQTWEEAPSIQPSKEGTGIGMSNQPSLACPMKPIVPPCKTKKKRVKNKTLKAANIPSLTLTSPRPTTQRRRRPRPADLASPSRVAMASFSTKSSPSDALKSTAQEGRATAGPQNGRESGERIYLKYPPSTQTQASPSHPQAPKTFKLDEHLVESISSTKGGSMDMAGDWDHVEQEIQLSPLVIPVSVAVSSKDTPFNKASRDEISLLIKKPQNAKPLSKNSRHPSLLKSLITPNLAVGGYPSQLRSPTYLSDHLLNFDPPPYTPLPMLSPLRPGSGLYFNTLPQCQPCLSPPSIYSACLDDKDGISLTLDNTVSIKPKINVGSRFQAEIPPLRNPLFILYDEHPAQLMWTPWGDLSTNPETQQKVTQFLDMCCSSVLPGGGTNTELALHCLHEVQGDILAALDLLLVRGDFRTFCHPLSDYHYTGSVQWTKQEIRDFQKALLNQTKDFQFIQKVLQTKSVAQCVEYYYTTKKLKTFKRPCRRTENAEGAGKNSVGSVYMTKK